MLYYLAYGSNLHPERLIRRVPSSRPIGYYKLSEYQLAFHKQGVDGSGKCDAFYTGNSAHYLLGVIYALDDSERTLLDEAEDLGRSYQLKTHNAVFKNQDMELFFYVADADYVNPGLSPFCWYKSFVRDGARFHGLPGDYIRSIASVPSQSDPDHHRRLEHEEILHQKHLQKHRTFG